MASKTDIPHFGLYGESSWIDDPEFFHIEDIQSRSENLDWKISAHRHTQLFQILILKAGGAQVQMDDEQQNLIGSWAIIVPAGVVHGFRFAPDTDGRVITIAEPLLEDVYREKSARFIKPLLDQPSYINFNGHRTVFYDIWPLISLLEKESKQTREGRVSISEYLIKTILLLVHRQQQISGAVHSTVALQTNQIHALKELIEQHYKSHWNSEQYAQHFNTSVSRLNRLTKTMLNQSIHDLIRDRLLLEAKRNLIYTARSVEEIAYDLGFKDPGYFSRFFKKACGIPPGRFRSASHLPTT